MIGELQTLVLSPRVTVEVGELDGFEMDMADQIVSARTTPIKEGERNPETGEAGKAIVPIMEMGFKQPRIYSICSIRTLNGSPVAPLANIAEYGSVARALGSKELKVLTKWAEPLYSLDEEELKNAGAAKP